MTQKPTFRAVESKEPSYLQLWLSATIIGLFIAMLFFIISMNFYSDFVLSLPLNTILLFMVLLTALFNTLICEGIKYYRQKSKKIYTKIIIDNNGLTFLNSHNETIIAKILWKNIQPRENEKFDIDFSLNPFNRGYKYYFFWNLKESTDSKIPSWSANKFLFMFAKFTNKADLLKAFFSGITLFRPDITINPLIYNFYRLNPVSFEVDITGIKKENKMTFLIIVFCIIISLTITFLMYLFHN